jgi:hypothetical protein
MDWVENTISNSNSIVVEVCLLCHCIATAVVSLPVSRSLPSNGSICHTVRFQVQTTTFWDVISCCFVEVYFRLTQNSSCSVTPELDIPLNISQMHYCWVTCLVPLIKHMNSPSSVILCRFYGLELLATIPTYNLENHRLSSVHTAYSLS